VFSSATGLDSAAVYEYPKVAVIATGDEVVLPGDSLKSALTIKPAFDN
jgi:molybdopterin biosynthesis enzyme